MMDEYIRAMDERVALHTQRKAEQEAEAEAVKEAAMAEAQRYMAGLTFVDSGDAS